MNHYHYRTDIDISAVQSDPHVTREDVAELLRPAFPETLSVYQDVEDQCLVITHTAYGRVDYRIAWGSWLVRDERGVCVMTNVQFAGRCVRNRMG